MYCCVQWDFACPFTWTFLARHRQSQLLPPTALLVCCGCLLMPSVMYSQYTHDSVDRGMSYADNPCCFPQTC